MVEVKLPDATYRIFATLARERNMTMQDFLESLAEQLIALDEERETAEWMQDAEAMTAVRALRDADAKGEPVSGKTWQQFKAEHRW